MLRLDSDRQTGGNQGKLENCYDVSSCGCPRGDETRLQKVHVAHTVRLLGVSLDQFYTVGNTEIYASVVDDMTFLCYAPIAECIDHVGQCDYICLVKT